MHHFTTSVQHTTFKGNLTSHLFYIEVLRALTEQGDRQRHKQREKADPVGVGRAAVHLVLPADAHLNFDLCAVGQWRHPRVSDEQGQLVVGFLQTVQKHDLGVCGCEEMREM